MWRQLILSGLVVVLWSISASAQITFERADFEALIGQQFEAQIFDSENDTGLQELVDMSGEDQTWDFTSVSFGQAAEGTISYQSMQPTAPDVPGAEDEYFSQADFVIAIDFGDPKTEERDTTVWSFAGLEDDGVYSYGSVFLVDQDLNEDGKTPDTLDVAFEPPKQGTALPLSYGTTWSDTTEINSSTEILTAEVDGYGTLVLPDGYSAEALRVRKEVEITSFGQTTQRVSYEFITKEGLASANIYEVSEGTFMANYQVMEDVATGVEQVAAELPNSYRLEQNYPNPFNPSTTIQYSLTQGQHVKLTVYDMLGQPVGVLVNKKQAAGTYEAAFKAGHLPSGMYFYRLQTGNFTQTRQMMLVK